MAIKFNRPKSFAADLAFKLISIAIPFQIIAIILHRIDFVSTKVFFALIGVGFLFAFCAILCGAIAYVSLWRVAAKGGVKATFSILLALAMFLPIAFGVWQNSPLPDINDVTTDLEERPRYALINVLRANDNFQEKPWGDKEIAIHEKAYPNLKPRFYDTSIVETALSVLAIADARGWEIVGDLPDYLKPAKPDAEKVVVETNAESPKKKKNKIKVIIKKQPKKSKSAESEDLPTTITIEATWNSLIVGFTNDVAIRLVDENERTKVDIRSSARAGRYDFRANAKEITAFLIQLDKQVSRFSKLKPIE